MQSLLLNVVQSAVSKCMSVSCQMSPMLPWILQTGKLFRSLRAGKLTRISADSDTSRRTGSLRTSTPLHLLASIPYSEMPGIATASCTDSTFRAPASSSPRRRTPRITTCSFSSAPVSWLGTTLFSVMAGCLQNGALSVHLCSGTELGACQAKSPSMASLATRTSQSCRVQGVGVKP